MKLDINSRRISHTFRDIPLRIIPVYILSINMKKNTTVFHKCENTED